MLCDELGYDVLGLTETHDTGRLIANRRFVVGEPAPAGDSASGVAMLLSERTAACITQWLHWVPHCLCETASRRQQPVHRLCLRSTTPAAVWQRRNCQPGRGHESLARLYWSRDLRDIRKKKRRHPSRADTFAELEALLESAPRGDCLLVMGDPNCRLPRSHGKRTGRWCIHTRSNAGGLELLEMMERLDLHAASTRFQPLRNHTSATYVPKDPSYNPCNSTTS